MRGMRTLFGICIFVVIGLVIVAIFSTGPATTSTTLHSFVTQTHQQLNHLHKLKEEFEGDQPLDRNILRNLGFVENAIVFPNHSWANISLPVIVSAVSSTQIERVQDLIEVTQLISSNSSLVIFGLDLYQSEITQVENECNGTCIFLQFDFSKYPSHVRDLRLGAYRPIIIQEMVQRASVILWLDACMTIVEPVSDLTITDNIPNTIYVSRAYNYINAANELSKDSSRRTMSKRNVGEGDIFRSVKSPILNSQESLMGPHYFGDLVRKAMKNGGIVTWPVTDKNTKHLPTPAMTHPDMFKTFHVQLQDYYFQQMSSPSVMLIINLRNIHEKLLRPWVSCALRQSCLSPIGAKATECIYNKKPLFRYSNCHLYDLSAFNVALGIAFGPDTTKYLNQNNDIIFQCLPKDLVGKTSLDVLTQPSRDSYNSFNDGNVIQVLPKIAKPPAESLISRKMSRIKLRKTRNFNRSLSHKSKFLNDGIKDLDATKNEYPVSVKGVLDGELDSGTERHITRKLSSYTQHMLTTTSRVVKKNIFSEVIEKYPSDTIGISRTLRL